MNRLPLIALLVFFHIITLAQSPAIHVTGRISSVDGSPIGFALIKIKASLNKSIIGFSYADSGGLYDIIVHPPADSMAVEVSKIGYQTWNQLLPVEGRNNIKINVRLDPSYKGLPPIVISTTPKIVQRKDTTIFNADSYKAADQKNIADLLKKVPGFTVSESGKISFNGQAITKVLLENDDLYNADYGSLINNISPDGIEKLEVIQHYKDKSNLLENFNAGSQQVLNLKFKKKKFIRTYGNLSAAGGPNGNYENKADIVGIIPKIKFVAFGNMNTIGDLSQKLLSRTDQQMGSSDNTYNTALPLPDGFSSLSEVSSQLLSADRYSINNTKIASGNISYSVTKSLKIRAGIQWGNDDYKQYQTYSQHYFSLTPLLVINERDSIHKHHNIADVWTDLNYNFNNRFQLIYRAEQVSNNSQHNVSGTINNLTTRQGLQSNTNLFTQYLQSNYVINQQNLLSLSAHVAHQTLPETMSLAPFAYDTSFGYNGNYKYLTQAVTNQATNYDIAISYNRKMATGSLALNGSYGSADNSLNTGIHVFNYPDSLLALNSNFSNNLRYTDKNLKASAVYSSALSKYFDYSISGGITNNALSLKDLKISSPDQKAAPLPLFAFNANYKINNVSQWAINYSYNSILPEVRNLLSGYVLSDYHSLVGGTNNLSTGGGNNITSYYSFNDLFGKKLLFLAGVISTIDRALYVPNIQSGGQYAVNTYLPVNKENSLVGIYSRTEKFLPHLKSRIVLNISGNLATRWSAVDGNLQPSHTTGGVIELHYYSSFEGLFNTEFQGLFNRSSQKIQGYPADATDNFTLGVVPSVKLFKALNIKVNMNYLATKSNFSGYQAIVLADASADFPFWKNKWQLSLKCKNLFNQSEFKNSYTNLYYYYSSAFQLQRIAIVGLAYKF